MCVATDTIIRFQAGYIQVGGRRRRRRYISCVFQAKQVAGLTAKATKVGATEATQQKKFSSFFLLCVCLCV